MRSADQLFPTILANPAISANRTAFRMLEETARGDPQVGGHTKVLRAPTVLRVKSEVKSPSLSRLAIDAASAKLEYSEVRRSGDSMLEVHENHIELRR